MRIIADEWKKLTKNDKLRYKDLAKEDRMRFETELRQISSLAQQSGPADDSQLELVPPKKPLTPYMLFVKETRTKVAASHPHIKRLHIMKEVGRQWSSICARDLEHYQ